MTTNPCRNQRGLTLVEIMIVVAIIGLLAAIAVPGLVRARKRSQATLVLDNLRLIDASKEQYAVEFSKTTGTPDPASLAVYLKKNIGLYNVFSGGSSNDPKFPTIIYSVNDFNAAPIANGADTAFSDVVNTAFWSPYSAN